MRAAAVAEVFIFRTEIVVAYEVSVMAFFPISLLYFVCSKEKRFLLASHSQNIIAGYY